jgi:hypothetical protein
MFLTLLDRPEFLEAKTLRWFSRYRPRAALSFVGIGKLRGKSGLRLLFHAGCSGVGPWFWSGQIFGLLSIGQLASGEAEIFRNSPK